MARLSDGDVLQIRNECIGGLKQTDIAKKYGVSASYVSRLHRKKKRAAS